MSLNLPEGIILFKGIIMRLGDRRVTGRSPDARFVPDRIGDREEREEDEERSERESRSEGKGIDQSCRQWRRGVQWSAARDSERRTVDYS